MFFIFSFVHAPVCANCKVILVILIQKKKKKKKQKNDPYFGMGKNTKVMPQNALLSIFSLGKGREYLRLKPCEKLSVQVCFLTCPPHALIRKSVEDTPQNCPKMNISREFRTFPVTEGNKIWHSFQIRTPTRKLTQDMNFGHSKIIRHFRPENPQIQTQNDMNFGHSKIIHHFGPENPQIWTQNDTNLRHSNIIWHLRPENPQKPTQKDTTFEKMHSLTLTQIRKVFVFTKISYHLHLY